MKRLKGLKRLALLVTLALLFSMVSWAGLAFAIPVFVTTSPLPNATTGEYYSHQFEATGEDPIQYFVSGLLGSGFSMTTGGLLSGTPTTAAIHTFQVTAHDNDGQTTQYFELTVNDPAGFDFISPAVLPDGYLNVPYSYTLQFAAGALANVQLFEGSTLPPGLTLNSSTGVISGTPTYPGGYMFTLQALDTEGSPPVLRVFSMTVISLPDPPVITTESLPDGTVGAPYDAPLAATGTGFLEWSVAVPYLPDGLMVYSAQPNIAGTPTIDGSFTFTLRVTDPFDQFDEKQFTINIEPEEDTEYTFVETIEVLEVTATTATIKGEMFEFGVGNVRRGFIYGSSLLLDEGDNDGEVSEVVPVGASEFTLELTGLSPGTDYHVRAFVAGESGYAYGQILQFTTLGSPDTGAPGNGDPDPGDLDPDELEELPKTAGGGVLPVVLSMVALGGYLWMHSRKKKQA